MAPEVIEQSSEGYDTKVDIWSLGITAIELATGFAPYHNLTPMQIISNILNNDSPKISDSFSLNFRNMIDQCLQKNPNQRPTAKELLRNDFFNNLLVKTFH